MLAQVVACRATLDVLLASFAQHARVLAKVDVCHAPTTFHDIVPTLVVVDFVTNVLLSAIPLITWKNIHTKLVSHASFVLLDRTA
jgi:hypothetical protein